MLFSELAPEAELAELAAVQSEQDLITLGVLLGARDVAGWSAEEERLVKRKGMLPLPFVKKVKSFILEGLDPLGTLLCQLRGQEQRRSTGTTLTPQVIVESMVQWAANQSSPSRVIDPGTGTARYLLESARVMKSAPLVGIETDPLTAILARANLATSGYASRSQVIVGDYRKIELPSISGRTLFIGNPPYVRHHLIDPQWKDWLTRSAASLQLAASQLAGLHVHFFLATVLKAKPRDIGAFITAAEWLDVNYGSLVRELFLGPMGGNRIVVVEPTAKPFPDAASTAAITYFEIGSRPQSIRLKRISKAPELACTGGGRLVRRERLEVERRWSHLTRVSSEVPAGFIELGELCRVHRGQVTGANKLWIAGEHSAGLPSSVLFATVTKARELIRAGRTLDDDSVLKRVIDLPEELDELGSSERKAIEKFLKMVEERGARKSYTANNRRVWWSVGLRQPAPILATYMARRAPAFVRNKVNARHINIAHGLYPREPLSDVVLDKLVDFLGTSVLCSHGRTYAGGLTKFEPREMERLPVPEPRILLQQATA